ncbi:hypothetical protein HRbin02_00705 [Candidatus Calditenuaceae archaeon HR02]|nr:hypothetical protein HRbin02_00705 [Candidatus Calditenuaceae archaeon HR02]
MGVVNKLFWSYISVQNTQEFDKMVSSQGMLLIIEAVDSDIGRVREV